MLFRVRIVSSIFLFAVIASGQPRANLPNEEVEALRLAARSLGKTDWNFSVNPCSGESGWVTPNANRDALNSVTCNCSFVNNTICHVVSIVLRSQGLEGRLPSELERLPFLQEIDLNRNYLQGTIPPEWGTMNLVNISLLGNRLTGTIPRELANISTLTTLTLEYNHLTGSIPPEFGNLSRLERLAICSNNLTGELPTSLANLTALRYFVIGDNNFSGSIPDFIGNWPNLDRIMIQASGLSGPIPSSISSLTRLTDVRISDLNGNDSSIPSLMSLASLRILVLRSCNIIGQIPDFFGQMTQLSLLDLSFNKLSGPIPDNFYGLRNVNYIYLTGNSLEGRLPTWMMQEGQAIDLSYNNLSSENSPPACQLRNLNLFASSRGNTTGIVPCVRNFPCTQTYHDLNINCGGRELQNIYEEDIDSGGPSNVHISNNSNWVFSSTGHFLDGDPQGDRFIWQNTSRTYGPNPELYMDARLSPLSLTYYGYCLQNGNYTVTLHFAEIIFTDNIGSGRRIFDIYIQGNLVQRDFNIEDEAGGLNIGIERNFTAVVTDSTLDIRFYWAGKGTTGIPVRGVYGPLISAISVNSEFSVPSDNGNNISTGAVVGIMIGVLSGVLLLLAIFWWMGCFKPKDTLEYELKGVDLQTTSFTLKQIKAATNNFDSSNKIGEGGFGPVYKGLLSDGTAIAVKMLSAKSKQGNREFVTEIGMISALQHPCLVKLYGCCIDGNQLLLIYEYMENNSLARALFGPEQHKTHLDWETRYKICIGIARGLAYLHEESRLKIIHRDIKATNVLLDKSFNPKISDFGLAKLYEEDKTHMSTRVAGTYGYLAPEYAMRGHLTYKADVYSFGVLLLELVCGRPNTSFQTDDECSYLLDWANELKENGDVMELIDPRLGSKFNKEVVLTAIQVALLCTNIISTERPSMSTVVGILEGRSGVEGFISDSSGKTGHKEMKTSDKVPKYSDNGGVHNSLSLEVLWADSSTSSNDLYPVASESEYWEKRDQ